ncbi:YgaP family membrane protein [Shimia biformata]|uniref:YgaP family membrane protein n=1 Tax=Shimia biformata TaxID=1294299 RepID=UPI0019519F75|nr:DUF2892 domain-containing protein [Shimia biformata]
MLKKNVGTIDRILRIILGIALLVAYAMTGSLWLLIGIVPLVSGLMSSCMFYSILGLSTCPVKTR